MTRKAKEQRVRGFRRKMSESSLDSSSTCSLDSCPIIEEPYFGESFSDDSLNDSDDIFPLSYYSEEGWNSPDDNSSENIFDMSAEKVILISDDDVGFRKEPKKKAVDTSRGKDKKSSIFIPDGDYGDEVLFVEPESYSPKKKMKLDEEKRTAVIDNSSVGTDTEITVTFAKKGIDFAHAREHCRVKKFVLNPTTTAKNASNEEFCEKCYCYVCDDFSSKCESWKTGEKPHCNAYAKHAFWENERRLHKRNTCKKKFIFVPILSLLAPQKINQEMTKAGITCLKYAAEMQEVSDSSYDVTARKTCGCYCHENSFRDYVCCPRCEWEHLTQSIDASSELNERVMDKVRVMVSNSVNLAESYIKRKQPNATIVILDTMISLLLGVDINSPQSIKIIYERDSSRLISLWIEAALGSDKNILSKAKQRLSESVAHSQNSLFLLEAKKIHKIVSELRPYDDPLVVKCLTKRQNVGRGLKEPYEVAKIRLEYLTSNNRHLEALNYILGVETDAPNNLGTHRLCDYSELRNELVDLLVIQERMQDALTVCTTHLSNPLPTNLEKGGKKSTVTPDENDESGNEMSLAESSSSEMNEPSGSDSNSASNSLATGASMDGSSHRKSFNNHWTPIKSLSLKTFKKLFLGLVKPNAISLSEDGLKKAMTITLPGMYYNGAISTLECFEFLFEEINGPYKNYKYASEAARKDAQQSASSFLETKVKKGYNQFQPEDIKAPKNVSLRVYTIELLVQIASSRYSVLRCLQSLVKKGLYWVCQSLLFSPKVQSSVQPSEVSYFTKNILPSYSETPLECFKIWFTNIHAITHFQVLFDLVCDMFDVGSKKYGPESVKLKTNAVLLSQTLMESILLQSYGRRRSVIEGHFKTVQEKFSIQLALELGISSCTWGPLEIEFVLNPSFKALKAIRNRMGNQRSVLFKKKQEVLLQFLKKNCRFLQHASIEIFIRLEMYKDLLECLNKMSGDYNGYESSLSQINTILEDLKRMGDKTKTLALAEALKNYVATALVQACFSFAFRQPIKPIPRQVSDCVKLICYINKPLFMSIIQKAVDDVIQKYLWNTVSQQKRNELGSWLLDIKAIFTSVNENRDWLMVVLPEILNGPLKRKQQIVTCLRRTTDLF